ncbi:hypothetical protein V5O48_005654 [Marasmius crinis-equi]|uniref:F-box domain-containing protein n=1 Tax=Marasmius crinis-equi TaxID=585013 RepID=A0ABR3FLR2_9AGAR
MFPTLARNMLRRSRCTPLNISWRPSYRRTPVDPDDQDAIFIQAAQQTSRIASLDLSTASLATVTLFDSVWKKMTGAAPLLHTIRIYCLPGPNEVFAAGLPDTFLAGKAPRLVTLSLTGCSLSWRSSLFQNLTSLAVRYPPAESKPEVQVIFEALRSMRSLVTLELRHCISPASLPDCPSGEALSLPYLQRLVISIESIPCLSLLQHMSFPDTTVLHLTCYEPPLLFPVEQLFSYVSNLLAPAATAPNHPRIIRGLSFTEELSLSLIARNTRNSDSELILAMAERTRESSSAFDLSPHLRLDIGTRQLERDATISSLSGLVPPHHLETLRIDCGSPFPREALFHLLSQSTLLKSLFIQECISLDFLELLSKRSFLPALQTLTLTSVNFRANTEFDLFTSVVDCLQCRSQNGFSLKELFLNDCVGLYPNDIGEVQNRVHYVSWNGLPLTKGKFS